MIEIKITDIQNLTVKQIDDLMDFLLNSRSTETLLNAEVSKTNTEPLKETSSKTRKKRKEKLEFVELLQSGEVGDIYNLKTQTWETPITSDSILIYSDLIPYILENIRTKKIEFVQVMQIIQQYNIPTLNELENHPDLIVPIHQSIKGLIL